MKTIRIKNDLLTKVLGVLLTNKSRITKKSQHISSITNVVRTPIVSFGKLTCILCIGLTFVCCESIEIDPSHEEATLLNQADKFRIKSCDESFPNLGPSASSSQSCNDVSNPINKGKLDCRTVDSYGGYANDGQWGEYKVKGGAKRYDGTQTRVERFFNSLKRGTKKRVVLSGTLRIVDLSDGNTCIIQSHAGGKILDGLEKGRVNTSAQFLVYAMYNSDGSVRLETHRTNNPYTSSPPSGGDRDRKFFRNIDIRQNYPFVYETGYNSKKRAYSKLTIGGYTKTFNHSHTTERVYVRYGAYGTSDTGDTTAHIRFSNIDHCRN